MFSVSKVEVLCPNGHRVIVNVKPNTKLLQVAEECCLKQRLGAVANFGLKMRHNQRPVDLSLSVQLAGLTNNAKLDLYQRTNQKANSRARVALQIDGAGRFQREFDPSTTLWELLEGFQMDDGSGGHLDVFGSLCDGQQPVINYMKEEILGEYALRSTTLRSLGILDGGHLLRLSFKTIGPEVLQEIREKIDREKARLARLAAKAASIETLPQNSSSGDQLIVRTAPESMQCSESGIMDNRPDEEMDTTAATELPTDRGNFRNRDQALQMDVPARSGGLTYQQFPFMEFKFPEETKGMHLYHNELSAVNKEDFKPCDRETVLYKLNDIQGIEHEAEDDEFFDHTVDDIKKLQASLSREVTSYDQPLMTEAMRTERRNAKFSNYSRFILRFHFPDGFILQGVFRPLETVLALYKYVKENLEDKNSEFELYMSPPKIILDKKAENLIEAGLSPMSVIYFKAENRTEGFLTAEVIKNLSSLSEAKQVHAKYKPTSPAETQQQSCASGQPSTSKQTSGGPSHSQNSANATSSDKIPKWFKTGK